MKHAGPALAAAVLCALLSDARAAGISATDPLYYSGYLEDASARAIEGTFDISIQLWPSDTASGTALCQSTSLQEQVRRGRFRVKLDPGCVAIIGANPDLWVQVNIVSP